jgi:uncharacterized protein (UPF0333 family)
MVTVGIRTSTEGLIGICFPANFVYYFPFPIANAQFLDELTQKTAIQCEENGQLILLVHQNATTNNIPFVFPFRLNHSFRQFKIVGIWGETAEITATWNSIGIWAIANITTMGYEPI